MNVWLFLLTSFVFTTSSTEVPLDKTLEATVEFKDLNGTTPDINKLREELLFSYNAFELPPFRLKKETVALPKVTWLLEPQKEGKTTLTVGTTSIEIEVLPPTAPPDPYYLNNPLPLMSLDREHPLLLDEEVRRKFFEKAPFEETSFPWNQLIAAIFVMAFIFGVRLFLRGEKEEVVSKVRLDEMRSKFLSLEHPKILETEEILKNYLKEKTGIDATKKTTRERVFAIATTKNLKKDEKEALVHYFTLAERVKFRKAGEAGEEIKVKKIGETLFS